jgi:hypothetical protein
MLPKLLLSCMWLPWQYSRSHSRNIDLELSIWTEITGNPWQNHGVTEFHSCRPVLFTLTGMAPWLVEITKPPREPPIEIVVCLFLPFLHLQKAKCIVFKLQDGVFPFWYGTARVFTWLWLERPSGACWQSGSDHHQALWAMVDPHVWVKVVKTCWHSWSPMWQVTLSGSEA